MKIIVSLLICCFITLSAAQAIQVDVFAGSNSWWIALAVRNAGVDTRTVQLQEAGSTTWDVTSFQSGWGYFTFSPNGRPLNFPISVQLTSVDGKVATIYNIIPSASAGLIDTAVAYGGGVIVTPTDPTSAPTDPTSAPIDPTSAPDVPVVGPSSAATSAAETATDAPTDAPTTEPTAAPTVKAATAAPTVKVATAAPTVKVATAVPTVKAATAKPGSATGCSAPMKLMVPLYTYPGASWDAVAASGRTVPTVAIINPNSGPGTGPDSAYNTYMTKLNNAGVEMVGYVHTLWGARDINLVKSEINTYASQFPYVVGIFLDEAAATDAELPYYQQLYDYIMGMPGWKYDIINPGTIPTPGYVNAATQIVSFEDVHTKFAASATPSYASCNNKDKFAVITYGATSSGMTAAVATAKSKGYYGWFYVTDGAGGCCTYNALTSYYASMATAVANANSN